VATAHVRLVDVLLAGSNLSFDQSFLDILQALVVLTRGWHHFNIRDESRPFIRRFCDLELVAHPSLSPLLAISCFRIVRGGDHVSLGLAWRAGRRLTILATGELLY